MEIVKSKRNFWELLTNSHREIKYISFGDVCYWHSLRKITHRSKEYKLTAKPALMLDYFIENQNRTITRQAIIDHVWKEKGCSDENFHQTIGILRKELGDSGKPWQYITNPNTNCYALKPTVKIHYVYSSKDLLRFAKITLAVLILVATVSTGVIKSNVLNKQTHYQAFNYQKLTHLKGQVKRAALSPDQSLIVFMHKPIEATSWDLRVQPINTNESKLLVKAKHPLSYLAEPAFSPSGNQLAWVDTDYINYCEVWVADFNVLNLTVSNGRSVNNCVNQWARTPQWRTEEALLIATRRTSSKPKRLFELEISTNQLFSVNDNPETQSDAGYGDYGLSYNGETNKIAYLRQAAVSGKGAELRIFDYDSKVDKLLKQYPHSPFSTAWLNTDELFIKGIDGFEVIDLNGDVFAVNSDILESQSFPFSMGHNQIGFVRGALNNHYISLLNLATNKIDNSFSSQMYEYEHDYRLVISKESENIAFLSHRNNKKQLVITREGMLSKIADFHRHESVRDLAISPNGKLLAFVQDSQLTIIDDQGSLLYKENMQVVGLSFGYDNQTLYLGVKENGRGHIKKLETDQSFKTSVVAEGVFPKTTKNGDLYFIKSKDDNNELYFYRINLQGQLEELIELPFPMANINSSSFDVIEAHLYYVEVEGKNKTLVKMDFASKETTQIAPVTSLKFSLNENVTKVVMTQEGQIQNNLASFSLIKK